MGGEFGDNTNFSTEAKTIGLVNLI